MKKNLDNFDDLVKNKLDGLDFSFNEANWEKASQMIEATRPAKKPFANLLLVSSIILTGALIIGSAYYFSSGSSNSDIKNIAQNNTVNENSNPNAITNSEVKDLTSTTNPSEEKNQSQTLSNSKEENNSSKQQNTNETVLNTSTSSEIKSKTKTLNSDKKENKAMVTENSGNGEQKTVSSSQKEVNSNESAGNSQEVIIGGESNNIPTKSQTRNNEPGLATTKEESPKHKTKSSEKETSSEEKTSSNKSGTVYQPIGKTNPENEVKENTISPANEPTSEEKELIETPKEQTAQITIAQPDTASSEIAKKDYVQLKHHSISIEGGATNSFGWAVNGVRNGNSVSPIAGINYMYHITDKSSLLFGVQYNSISNLTESNVSFSVTSYGFGVNNNVTTYKIIGLQYLTTPIKYIHKLDKNNSIGVGLNMTYLLNVQNKIESNNTVESNVQTITTKYDNGYGFDKMNRYNAQLALSYTRKVSKKLGFNVELNQSLQNVFKDYSYFGASTKNSKPAALKLSFTYTIFNK